MSIDQNAGRFLTETQRAYLAGQHECPNDNAEYQIRSNIRSRIGGALFEFKIINEYLSDRDLEQIFENWKSDMNEYPDSIKSETQEPYYQIQMPANISEIESVLSLAYRGYMLNGMDANEFVDRVIEAGLQMAEADRKGAKKNQVTIDLELKELEVHTGTDELDPIEKFDKGIAMTWEEQQKLYNQLEEKLNRDISLSEAGELIEEHLLEGNESTD